jgi:thiol:disulfide interchange protein DsbC
LRGAREAVYALVAACILIALGYQSGFPESGDASPKTLVGLSDKEMSPILEKINMPKAKVLAIRPSPVEGWWEVGVENNGRRFVIYVDSSKKYITPGPFIDYANQKDITRERIEELNKDRKIDVSRLPLGDALLLGQTGAPVRVVVFTDPG